MPSLLGLRHLTLLGLLIALALTFTIDADAARTARAKGKAALIVLSQQEATSAAPGDTFMVYRGNRKVGTIVLRKVKGRRALGQITEGATQRGDRLVLRPRSSSTAGRGAGVKSDTLLVGGVIGMGSASQSVEVNTGDKASLAGTGFHLLAVGDYSFMGKLGLKAQAGLQQLSVEDSGFKMPDSNKVAKTDINYFGLDFLLRYRLVDSRYKAFLAGGISLLIPMSHDTTAVSEDSVAATSAFLFQGGVYIPVGTSMSVPIQVNYHYFPPSDTVTTSVISAQVGLLFPF